MRRFPWWLAAFLVPAFWPVWRWYALRMADGSDEKWGFIPLTTLLLLGWIREGKGREGPPLGLLAAVVGLYALSYPFLPPILRASLAVVALGVLLAAARFHREARLGVVGLLLLALPVSASLQFTLGFPLRLLATRAAAGALSMFGMGVQAQGTALRWMGETVVVDAPCSGVKMLWAGAWLVLTLAVLRRLPPLRTLAAAAAGLIAILLANIFRSTALFFREVGLVRSPAWTHAGLGIALFAFAALAIYGIVAALGRGLPEGVREGGRESVEEFSAHPRRARITGAVFLLACAAASAVPLWPNPSRHPARGEAFSGWPATFEGKPLSPMPMTPKEVRLLQEFPGRAAAFTDGERQIVLRWVNSPTRRLHPAADCFRGSGYSVNPLPPLKDGTGALWGRFEASNARERLEVRERIWDGAGGEWSDASSWYWSAALGRTRGPWWAVTVAMPE